MNDPFDKSATRMTGGNLFEYLALALGLLIFAIFVNFISPLSEKWTTLVGRPNDPASNFVELGTDTMFAFERDRIVRLRINRAVEVKGVTGVAYRSFDGTAEIDCRERSARYVKVAYYRQPNFKGAAIGRQSFRREDVRPVLLKDFDGRYKGQLLDLVCQ